jgi:hypothetical protein
MATQGTSIAYSMCNVGASSRYSILQRTKDTTRCFKVLQILDDELVYMNDYIKVDHRVMAFGRQPGCHETYSRYT